MYLVILPGLFVEQGITAEGITIENDVWLGAGAINYGWGSGWESFYRGRGSSCDQRC